MNKSYYELMDEITKEELLEGLVGYGLFHESIPPILTSKPFYDFCQNLNNEAFFETIKERKFIQYESMRNISIPRVLAIPHPMAYWNLCNVLSQSWEEIKERFKEKTENNPFKISRIHIRKLKNEDRLFKMSYKNFQVDSSPEFDLSIGKKYLVKADISNCFPSFYTHSIPWALVGKDIAKQNKNSNNLYYNKIDKFARNLKDAETHGILIGPDASNILSEIILTSIDNIMTSDGFYYIRNIDDYAFYAQSYEEAEKFLLSLAATLKEFSLSLNYKKTEILPLPLASNEHWITRLNSLILPDKLNFKEVRIYLDIAIELMQCSGDNLAVINYVTKTLANKKMTINAKEFYVKRIHHLVLLYPYLVRILEKDIFLAHEIEQKDIKSIADNLFKIASANRQYEAVSYAIYFAIKNNFKLNAEQKLYNFAEESNDCIFMLLAYLYDKKFSVGKAMEYKDLAKSFIVVTTNQNNQNKKKINIDEFWLFIYEALSLSDLYENLLPSDLENEAEWKTLKENDISFLKPEFRN
ncbi:RNA-directed DNA polymerase [Beggiatoa leptomitoformis]|uniref:Reverse transcriptase domain-containing protein n=1 Tax=Beggiatoa leptomitoformis TaxID=288004 RepID=A0A2N9YHM0_9GAMM|nr:RNA-directed DNA polymerase [Beggiatoa leptomitoformis]ALG67711.1 hypothetical protein AL038_08305 [Beggiatoa leptomitoformis]AUI70051.1 hypothetical protein BLE401_16000 [Beggiatoa leptomitoformis]